jgi:hypothetical protein
MYLLFTTGPCWGAIMRVGGAKIASTPGAPSRDPPAAKM